VVGVALATFNLAARPDLAHGKAEFALRDLTLPGQGQLTQRVENPWGSVEFGASS
jgi:hypothetical protein